MRLLSVTSQDIPTVRVDLKAPPEERWTEAMEVIGDHIHQMVNSVLKCCDEGLDDRLERWSWPLRYAIKLLARPSASLGGQLVGLVANWFGQEYPREIRGLADAAGVSYSYVLLANLMYDIVQRGACSSYSCNLPDGSPLLARNMDWSIPDDIGRHTVLVHFVRGQQEYLSVAVAGMVGVLSAMCPGRWAVTVNKAPAEVLGTNGVQTPVLQHLRSVCDRFGNFRTLVRRVQHYQTMSPFFAHVVGLEEDEHLVVNGFGEQYSVRKLRGRALVQTNHFVEHEFGEFNPDAEWGDEEGRDTQHRYGVLERRLRTRPRSLKAAMGRLGRSPITNERTMQSMVFCPGNGKWLLKIRK